MNATICTDCAALPAYEMTTHTETDRCAGGCYTLLTDFAREDRTPTTTDVVSVSTVVGWLQSALDIVSLGLSAQVVRTGGGCDYVGVEAAEGYKVLISGGAFDSTFADNDRAVALCVTTYSNTNMDDSYSAWIGVGADRGLSESSLLAAVREGFDAYPMGASQ